MKGTQNPPTSPPPLTNLPKGTIEGDVNHIIDLHDKVISGAIPRNEKRAVRFQTVDGQEAEKLKKAVGLDLKGYKHSIDSFGIRHSYNEHGKPEAEARRGQEAITAADFAKIPDIINNYDEVKHVGQDKTGNDLIQYKKRYNGTTYYVEEVRDKRGELSTKTIWKTRTASNAPSSEGPPLTSETFSRNLPNPDNNIPPSPKDVKTAEKLAEVKKAFEAKEKETQTEGVSKGLNLEAINKKVGEKGTTSLTKEELEFLMSQGKFKKEKAFTESEAETRDIKDKLSEPAEEDSPFVSLDDVPENELAYSRSKQGETQKQIEDLYDYAVSNESNQKKNVVYRTVGEAEADRIKKATGLDVEGYSKSIDNYAINHILNQHGDEKTEAARGNIAVTKDDIARIPEITANADQIVNAGKSGIGRDTIRYEKRVNGTVYIYEEARTGKRELVPVTMYKKKVATNDMPLSLKASSTTSETLRNLPDKNIPSTGEKVKSGLKTKDVESKVNDFRKINKNAPKMRVVQSITDLSPQLREDIARSEGKGDIAGIFDPRKAKGSGLLSCQHDIAVVYLLHGTPPSHRISRS